MSVARFLMLPCAACGRELTWRNRRLVFGEAICDWCLLWMTGIQESAADLARQAERA